MYDKDLLQALRRLKVETGSLACMECGHEHNCGVHGCAIIRAAAERIEGLLKNEAQLRRERALPCAYYRPDSVCAYYSEPGITSYCVEGPCPGYEPDRIRYGDYLALSDAETPAEIQEATELLAEQAGECVKKAILEGKVIRSPLTIGWKVEIHRTKRRTADD